MPGLSGRVEAECLRESLTAAHSRYATLLTDGTWPHAFSGKEIVHEFLGWIWTRQRPAGNAAYEDLAKAVAQAQRSAGRVPAELLELHTALVARRLA